MKQLRSIGLLMGAASVSLALAHLPRRERRMIYGATNPVSTIEKQLTQADLDRIEKAKAKRERKAAKRVKFTPRCDAKSVADEILFKRSEGTPVANG